MKSIPLSRGLSAIVDDADYESLTQHSWHAVPAGRNGVSGHYAVRCANGCTPSTVYMHREILGAGRGHIVDHADRNGLNNQRRNLRFCTASLNLGNTKRINRSGFRGVYWHGRKKRWYAQIQFAGQRETSKRFVDAQDAAREYDAMARRYFGEFATLNFPSAANDDAANKVAA